MNRDKFSAWGIALTLLFCFALIVKPLGAASEEKTKQKRADVRKMANETLARLYKVYKLPR